MDKEHLISVTKKFEFEAAHFLPTHLGKCKELHGHTYKLEVELAMPVDYIQRTADGMVLDFSILKSMVTTEIIDKLDHSLLNNLMETPTAERLVIWIVERLEGRPLSPMLTRVRLYETSNSYAEWRKPLWPCRSE